MAIIKAKSKRESKKEVTLSDSIWKDIDAYCKYAEIGGTIGTKRSSFIEAAAALVFEQDIEFQEFKNQMKTQPPKKVVKKETPAANSKNDNNMQQKKEENKKENAQSHNRK